jgi:hypothetical protein
MFVFEFTILNVTPLISFLTTLRLNPFAAPSSAELDSPAASSSPNYAVVDVCAASITNEIVGTLAAAVTSSA